MKHRKPSDINKSYSIELSRLICKHSETFDVPPSVIASILSVESDYMLHAVNDRSNDYGIGQINDYNIKAYNLDKPRLVSDLDYSVWATLKIFSWFYHSWAKKNIEIAVKSYNCGTNKACQNWSSVVSYYKKFKIRL